MGSLLLGKAFACAPLLGCPASKHAQVQIIMSSVLYSGCKVNRLRTGRVWAKWLLALTAVSSRAVPTQPLHLWGSPALPTPAADPAEAVLAVVGTRPDSEMATSSCPRRAAAGPCPTVGWPIIAAPVRVTSVPASRVAPDRRPSLGVGQSRPMASAFAPRILGPGDRSGWGASRPPASSGALARQVYP